MTINYVAVSDAKAEWGNKQAILVRYEGLNKNTLNRWLAEMRANENFRKGVINPTHKTVWIRLKTFENFLYFKQHHYLR